MADPNEAYRRETTSEPTSGTIPNSASDAKTDPTTGPQAQPKTDTETEIALPEQASRHSTSEIVEADVASETEKGTAAAPAGTSRSEAEAEQFRQFQRFLEFQKFQEWQRSQEAGDVAPASSPGTREKQHRPWWRRILALLRYKFVRRLVYALVILLLLPFLLTALRDSLLSSLFGTSGSAHNGTGGSAPPNSAPITSTSPQIAIMGVYNYLRGDQPARACNLFEPSGQQAFAAAYGATDCATAARTLHGQISAPGPYANPKFGEDAIAVAGPEAAVYGCRMQVTGGPALGSFKLTQRPDGGWIIAAYALKSSECP